MLKNSVGRCRVLIRPSHVHRCNIALNRIVRISQNVGRGAGKNIVCRCKGRCVIHKIVSASSIHGLKHTIVGAAPSKTPVALRSITSMHVKSRRPGLKLTSRGKGPTMLVAIAGRPGAKAVRLARGLRTTLTSLRGGLPGSMRVSASVFHRSHFVRDSVDGIRSSLCRKTVFIIVILFLFLTGAHAAVVSLVALPLSLIMTVLALRCLKLDVGAVDLNNVTVTVNSLISSTVISIRGM